MASSIARIRPETLQRSAAVIKCLGHPLRLRLLEALEDGERTVSELQEHTGARQSAVSRQLGVMRGHGIVDCRRDGVNVYYRIVEPKVSIILDCIRACEDGLGL